MERINVTKSILPDEAVFFGLLKEVLQSNQLTNNGPKTVELEKRLASFLHVSHLTLTANGTVALELALQLVGAAGKQIITSAFTYAATATAAMWLGSRIILADIDPQTLCVDPDSIADCMGSEVAAVMPVNIYGYPCDDAAIRAAAPHIPVIYDGAQAFGSRLHGRELLDFGDLAVCSLHATKVFHSAEGGFVVSHTAAERKKLGLLRAFGHENDDYDGIGINAKLSELHACMGLALLDDFHKHLEARKKIDALYRQELDVTNLRFPVTPPGFESNYAYFPVIFESEALALAVKNALNARGIFPRRYFYPALSALPYELSAGRRCPVAEDIAPRVLCLPLFSSLAEEKALEIARIVNTTQK